MSVRLVLDMNLSIEWVAELASATFRPRVGADISRS
jgi:hypothetical protein